MAANPKLSEEQIIAIRKQSYRERIILTVLLSLILAPILIGINGDLKQNVLIM